MLTKLPNFLLLLLLLVVSNSCKKDIKDDDPQPQTSEAIITAYKSEFVPQEMVALQSQNINFTQQVYEATIGTEKVKLVADKNDLFFIMPSLVPGSYNIITNIEGKAFSVPVKINQGQTVSDPQAFVDTKVSELTYTDADISNLETGLKNIAGAQSILQNIDALKQYREQLKQEIAAANPQEIKELADFMAANPVLFSKKTDPLQHIDSFSFGKKDGISAEEMHRQIVYTLLDRGSKVIISGCGTALFLLNPEPIASKLLGTAATVALVYNLFEMHAEFAVLFDKSVVPDGNLEATSISRDKKTYDFLTDKFYKIDMRQQYRNINNKDMNSTAPGMQDVIKLMDKLEYYWNQLKDKSGNILSGNSFHIKNITETKTLVLNVDPKYLDIKNISNANITATQKKDDYLHVKFVTTAQTDQQFTFDVVYNSEIGNAVSTINGNLKLKTYFLLDDKNAWVVPPTTFVSGEPRSFYLSEDMMTKATGIDYSKITFVNKSLDQKVQVTLVKNAESFSLVFTHTEQTTQYNTIEIYYNGSLVQTIAAEVVNPCSNNKIVGKWKLQDYYVDNNNPNGYSPNTSYYWNITIYDNGNMDFQASTESTITKLTYSFSSCYFSYNFFGCQHSFTYKEGTNEYTVGGCGGFHHHVYTKL